MSDSREEEQGEALTREDDELIERCYRKFYRADGNNDANDPIDHELRHQQPCIALDQRKGKNKMEKLNSNSNRRKMEAKAKKFLLSHLSRFDEHHGVTKNNTTADTTRRSDPPFPYNGEDFGGSPSRYLCFLRPSIPLSSSSPIDTDHTATAAATQTLGAENTVKPKNSSYYDFVKSLIETNDFYTSECNSHRDIPGCQAK